MKREQEIKRKINFLLRRQKDLHFAFSVKRINQIRKGLQKLFKV